MSEKLEIFERAFNSGCGGCRRTCECGRVFYDAYNTIYSWEEGELEALAADKNATALDYSVGTISLEGGEYCLDCDCWHKRAEQIMRFVDSHAQAIAEYLTAEKKRKQAIADAAPTVQ